MVLLVLMMATPAGAQNQTGARRLPFDVFRDRQPVLVIYAQSLQDDRIFEVHLALMEHWEMLGTTGLEVMDFLPGNMDYSAVARRLELPVDQFAVVLLNRNGEVVFRGNESDVAEHIIEALQQ
jgi:hypothetical protein